MKTKLLLFVFSILLFASCEGEGKYTVWTGEDQFESLRTELLDNMTFHYDTAVVYEIHNADQPVFKPFLTSEDLLFYRTLPIEESNIEGSYIATQIDNGKYFAVDLTDKQWEKQVRPYLQSHKSKKHLWHEDNIKQWLIDNNFEPTQRVGHLSSLFAQKNHRMIVYHNGNKAQFMMK